MSHLAWITASVVLCVTGSSAVAADLSAHDPQNQLDSGIEITASPMISKSAVKRLEHEKEKRYHDKGSLSERALMFTKNVLSY